MHFALAAHATYGLAATFVPMYEVQKQKIGHLFWANPKQKRFLFPTLALKKQIEALALPTLERILVIKASDGEMSVDEFIDAEKDFS